MSNYVQGERRDSLFTEDDPRSIAATSETVAICNVAEKFHVIASKRFRRRRFRELQRKVSVLALESEFSTRFVHLPIETT